MKTIILLITTLLTSIVLSQDLESRVKSLEDRVKYLEQELEKKENSNSKIKPKPKRTSDLKSIWRKLDIGFSKNKVRNMLGEPDEISKNKYTETWNYKYGSYNSGYIIFDKDGISTFNEPRWK